MTNDTNTNISDVNNGTGQGYRDMQHYVDTIDAAERAVAERAAAKRASDAATVAAVNAGSAERVARVNAAIAGLSEVPGINTNASTGTSARDASVQNAADAARQAAIDSIVGALKASGADMTSPTREATPGMLYNSADDAITFTSALPSPTPPGVEPELLADEGRDIQTEYDLAVGRVRDIEAKLAAFTFDAKTGQKVYEVSGSTRESLEAQLARQKLSTGHDIERLRALNAQRERLAARRSATSNEAIVRAAYSNGDQTKAELLDKMIKEEEARELARSIVRARRVGG
jgi:hypothetical protein